MNIMMITNTYLPHVGGVALSVHRFTEAYRARGHRVVVVCPEFEDQPEHEEDVMRVKAIQNFNGSDFSMSFPTLLTDLKEDFGFRPQVVHSHHPYFLGSSAIRYSAVKNAPLVFTHHTMYEQYTHYVPGDSPVMRRFVIELSTGYANMCNAVIAPSESIAELIRERGVETPIHVIPTGVDTERFANGDGAAFRKRFGIPAEAFVVGHLGRLAPEKNLEFLSRAAAEFLKKSPQSHLLIAGYGVSQEELEEYFRGEGLSSRVHFTGKLHGKDVADAYHAMNVFLFTSKSETQGMVLAEAMTAGVPVVGLNANGVREVLKDGRNGRMLDEENVADFVEALQWIESRSPQEMATIRHEVAETAQRFSMEQCADDALKLYEGLHESSKAEVGERLSDWMKLQNTIEREWELWSNRLNAAAQAIVVTAKEAL